MCHGDSRSESEDVFHSCLGLVWVRRDQDTPRRDANALGGTRGGSDLSFFLSARMFCHAGSRSLFSAASQIGANESGRRKCSGSWLPGSAPEGHFTDPSSRLHLCAHAQRLASGKLYPVTAAQLLPVFTEFLSSNHYRLISQRTRRAHPRFPRPCRKCYLAPALGGNQE